MLTPNSGATTANSRIPRRAGKVLPAAAALCEAVVGPYTETWTDGQPLATPAPSGAATQTGAVTGTTATAPAASGTSPASGSPSSGAVQLSVGLGAAAIPLVLAAML